MSGQSKNHAMKGGTSLYSLCMGVPRVCGKQKIRVCGHAVRCRYITLQKFAESPGGYFGVKRIGITVGNPRKVP